MSFVPPCSCGDPRRRRKHLVANADIHHAVDHAFAIEDAAKTQTDGWSSELSAPATLIDERGVCDRGVCRGADHPPRRCRTLV